MKVDIVQGLTFGAKILPLKDTKKIVKDKKFRDIKPIKNYSQYLKEYGLDSSREIKK